MVLTLAVSCDDVSSGYEYSSSPATDLGPAFSPFFVVLFEWYQHRFGC